MNEAIIANWNSLVTPDDHVYVLGDLGFCDYKELEAIHNRLNGFKTLIAGNHDRLRVHQYKRLGFESVHSELEIELEVAGPVLLNHFQYKEYGSVHESKFHDIMPENYGQWLLHGHIHNKKTFEDGTEFGWKVKDKQINVGVDMWDFKPVSEKQIEEIIANGGINETM